MPGLMSSEYRIETSRGAVYAKKWQGRETAKAPIILLHDSLGSVELWRDFPDQVCVATGHDVIAYDRLGFGRSDAHPGAIAFDFITDEAKTTFKAMLEAMEIDRFMVLGHSVGGGMAAAVAAQFPDRCAALMTEAAQAFVEDLTLAGIRDAEVFFKQEQQLNRLIKYHGDKTRWVLDAWIRTWQADEFKDWNLDAYLPKITCPSLIIHGEKDEYGSSAHPNRYANLTSGECHLRLLPGCGHVPHKEQCDLVLDEIRQFLEKIVL
ncbi:alpha/beta hydrolase [Terasakiella sp. A23]|uniref:alpha/beta fold hydrolase n=1 Tax=Terasakiella sp. FCG-A23 TaxID=3080561 RepID=UPI002953ED4D|nr:alpha/beta hydrolase [Terasakiella sp. A23]MDV7341827.1 alpha/beta hydrolase [Terasakiella sp. A23]